MTVSSQVFRPIGGGSRPRGPSHSLGLLQQLQLSFAASGCAAIVMVGADWGQRQAWDYSLFSYLHAAPVLFLAVGALIATGACVLLVLDAALLGWLRRDLQRRLGGAALAVLAAMASWPVATATFSGRRVGDTALSDWGPFFFVAMVGASVLLLSWMASTRTHIALCGTEASPSKTQASSHPQKDANQRDKHCSSSKSPKKSEIDRPRPLGAADQAPFCGREQASVLRFAAGCLVGAAAAIAIDSTVYVSLYQPLHFLLEASAWLLSFTGFRLALLIASRGWAWVNQGMASLAVATAMAGVLVGVSPELRQKLDASLAPAWTDEVYLGRHLRRLQLLELARSGKDSLELKRLEELESRFGLTDTALDPRWKQPVAPASKLAAGLRDGVDNIAVFYVDTLRADVAADPSVMPNLHAFRAQSLNFTRAYAAGSDTMRSLPALTGGNYFVRTTHAGSLTRLAEEGPHRSAVVISKSARVFLGKLRPAFRFEETLEVADYDSHEKVWGYGGHRPTASRLVDRASEFLDSVDEDEPFFLWMFHFDQHAWRELDDDYIERVRRKHGVTADTSQKGAAGSERYRVVARSIDEQFGRFLSELEASGHAEDTAVLFVSDHGEALGQNGYWVHSIFLWESLIHVPLVLHVPRVPARRVDTIVSLVDVAPTLAPILGGGAALYHGQDLLDLADAERASRFERRLPILARGAAKNRMSRLGVIDPETGRKLVLSIEALFPELYDVRDVVPDRHNLAPQRPEEVRKLLRQAATSPIFPRSHRDFDLLRQDGDITPQIVAAESHSEDDSEVGPSQRDL